MSSILLAVTATVPATPEWSPTVGIIISLSCLVILLLTFKIEKPNIGARVPILPISVPAFIAAMCFGHVIGVAIVLGLTNIGSI